MSGERPWRRILLYLSYDGTAYSGWQRQLKVPSVQQRLEEALSKATGEPLTVYGASRTDAGVHAMGQAAHFDTRCTIPTHKFPFVLNTLLPYDIRVFHAKDLAPACHARFSSHGKTYTYRIHNSRHASAIYRNIRAHVPVPIDVEAMREAGKLVLGTHDFAAFAATGSVAKTTVRTMYSVDISQEDEAITLVIRGNAFLYNMVRILTGTLIEIGQGHMEPRVLTEALATGNRLALGPTAPAHGLELTAVHYPWDEGIPMEEVGVGKNPTLPEKWWD